MLRANVTHACCNLANPVYMSSAVILEVAFCRMQQQAPWKLNFTYTFAHIYTFGTGGLM